jgi:hypothetical protein
MKNSIKQLNQKEINSISGTGVMDTVYSSMHAISSTSWQILAGCFPLVGGLVGYFIVRALSKPHHG